MTTDVDDVGVISPEAPPFPASQPRAYLVFLFGRLEDSATRGCPSDGQRDNVHGRVVVFYLRLSSPLLPFITSEFLTFRHYYLHGAQQAPGGQNAAHSS